MAQLKVTKKGPPQFTFDLFAGSKKSALKFDSKGNAVRELKPGSYLLVWVVQGPKDTAFSYAVTLDGKTIEEDKSDQVSKNGWETGGISVTVADDV